MGLRKVVDTFNDGKSDADKHFSVENLKYFCKLFRNKGVYPKDFETNSQNSLITTEQFKLKGLQFGNWLSTEDKFDYMTAFWVAMNDLNLLLQFPNSNLGLSGQLGVTFGSRGVPRALAHYHPGQQIINLSRYKDVPKISKMTRFVRSGGAGSLAHEYGHFIDFTIGYYNDLHPDFQFLTGARKTTNWKPVEYDKKKNPIRHQMELIMNKALLVKTKEGKITYSPFGERIRSLGSDYYSSKVEIWARIFEKWVAFNLHQLYRISNTFLTKDLNEGYKLKQYPTNAEIYVLSPMIHKLFAMIRKQV